MTAATERERTGEIVFLFPLPPFLSVNSALFFILFVHLPIVCRFGHSLLKPTFKRMDGKYSVKGPELNLADMFFNPDKLHEPGMIDDLLRGVATSSMETLDQFITEEVRKHLAKMTNFEDGKLFNFR